MTGLTRSEYLLDIDFSAEYALLQEQEAKPAKLFYVSKPWVGAADSSEARLLLAKILEGLTDASNGNCAFLLLGEAVQALLPDAVCSLPVHKLLQLGIPVYVAKLSLEYLAVAAPDEAKVVADDEIAGLLLRYEVVTLS
ncbi:MAG: hypothetical protein GX588_04360 [Clostridiaceae bacterium]|nr:hypothetical protein [Clostridiaceae bacterium]